MLKFDSPVELLKKVGGATDLSVLMSQAIAPAGTGIQHHLTVQQHICILSVWGWLHRNRFVVSTRGYEKDFPKFIYKRKVKFWCYDAASPLLPPPQR